jgi:prepilin-type N-terminal cleavage/methylation domain-containing protein
MAPMQRTKLSLSGSCDCGFRIADCGLAPGVLFNPQFTIRNPQSRRGVTLTEVVVASALLAISIAPLLKALTLAQVEDRAIERKSWSLLLAQRELECIRARCLGHYDACYRVGSKVIGAGYLCTATDDEDPNLRTVAVAVGLDQNGDGILSPQEVEVTLSTRLARR